MIRLINETWDCPTSLTLWQWLESAIYQSGCRFGSYLVPLSLQTNNLDQEIGALLFRCVAYGAQLIPAGYAFLALVEGVPERVERAVRHANRVGRGKISVLCVVFIALSAAGVPPCLTSN